VTSPIGVLAMAYGTAAGPEDVERYYTDIRGGRPPSPDLLKDLQGRYAAIGNRFPLLDITRRQAAALERALNEEEPGRFSLFLGMKHSPPFIPDGVREMQAQRIERGVGLVLAPHYSRLSVGSYIERVEAALSEAVGAGGSGVPSFTYVKSWHDHPVFIEALAGRVRAALDRLSPEESDEAVVVFSAHSLPARIPEEGDPYPEQLQETADLTASRLSLTLPHMTAWQSAGRTPEPWLGPDLGEVIRDLAARGHTAVIVCACGFVADNLEILYDLDVVGRQIAQEAGIRLVRTESMNDDPAFIRTLAAVVRDHVAAPANTWS
jgi:ferrochelatase